MREFAEVTSDIIEALFYQLTDKGDRYSGVLRSNTTNNQSALPAIAYGYAKKSITRIINKDLDIDPNDSYTNIALGPILLKLLDNLNQ